MEVITMDALDDKKCITVQREKSIEVIIKTSVDETESRKNCLRLLINGWSTIISGTIRENRCLLCKVLGSPTDFATSHGLGYIYMIQKKDMYVFMNTISN